MKKWISLVCVIVLTLALLPGNKFTVEASQFSGSCGDNLEWTAEGGNVLVISGTGPMYDYSEENRPPWADLIFPIFGVILRDGVTSIGDYAFAYNISSAGIVIPGSVTSIGNMAFSNLQGTLYFLGDPPEITEDAFYQADATVRTALWEDSYKQNHGGNITYQTLTLTLSQEDSKQLYMVGEPLDPASIVFNYKKGSLHDPYIPRQVIFGEYDNSTCGKKIVQITADESVFEFTYMVTDGTSHLDPIRLTFDKLPSYHPKGSPASPTLYWGAELLTYGEYYDTSSILQKQPGLDSTVTVTGKGILEGLNKTFYFPVLKTEYGGSQITNVPHNFTGSPLEPAMGNNHYEKGIDFTVIYENNINIGTGIARVIGINNCYGESRYTFEIEHERNHIMFGTGNLLGNIEDEVLSKDYAVHEATIPPTNLIFYTQELTHDWRQVAYQLYRVTEDDIELVEEYISPVSDWARTKFEYDFSYVYDEKIDQGGEVFALAYSWVDEDGNVYGGMYYLFVPSKVGAASSMRIDRVASDGDFRNDYFTAQGNDGVLSEIIWTSSDPSVATVEDGIVTLHKPGISEICAQSGALSAVRLVNAKALNLTEGIIFDYHEETGARVIWDSRILEEGTDYTMSVEKNGKTVTVTVTGCGLFTGELMKEFVNLDSLADPHTHGFTNSCDSTCNSCDFTRDRDHTFSTEWGKDLENHYHECTVCGEQKDVAEHTLTGNGKECTVCGRLWTPGDIDGNGLVNRDDVIALLLHVSMPAAFPISIPADYTGDDQITRDDVIQLLLHVSMPDAFPLQ